MSSPRIRGNTPYVFISHRTYRGTPFFSNHRLAERMVEILKYYEDRSFFRRITHSVMENHYHAVIQLSGKKSLERVLQSVHSLMAHSYGRANGFQRFWNRGPWVVWLESEQALYQRIAYTLLNPWRAGLVHHPLDPYPFSDIAAWREWKGDDYLLDLFGTYGRRWDR